MSQADVETSTADAPSAVEQDRMTIVVFSGDFDRWMAAFTLATSSAAMGLPVTMFFTFWGILGLREKKRFKGKSMLDRMFAAMLPTGVPRTSRMNFLGLGPKLFGYAMRKKQVCSLPDMIELARDLGVRMVVCEMSMDVMGISEEEIAEGVEFGGAATCVYELTREGTTPLMI